MLWGCLSAAADSGNAYTEDEFVRFATMYYKDRHPEGRIETVRNKKRASAHSKHNSIQKRTYEVGRKWFELFKGRMKTKHGYILSLKTAEYIDQERTAIDIELIKKNHEGFVKLCSDLDIDVNTTEGSNQVGSLDEKGISGAMNSSKSAKVKVLMPKSCTTRPLRKKKSNREHVTALMGALMSGRCMPSVFIDKSKAKKFQSIDIGNMIEQAANTEENEEEEKEEEDDEAPEVIRPPPPTPLPFRKYGGLHDAYKTSTKTSYICVRIMEDYIDTLDNWLTANSIKRPFILVFDGHSSHLAPILCEKAKNLGIEFYVIPPHTSQVIQAMDDLPNQQTSSKFSALISKLTKATSERLTTDKLIQVFAEAIVYGNSPSNAIKAFESTGYFDEKFDEERFTKYTNASIGEQSSTIAPVDRFETMSNKVFAFSNIVIPEIRRLSGTSSEQMEVEGKRRRNSKPSYSTTGHITNDDNMSVMLSVAESISNQKEEIKKISVLQITAALLKDQTASEKNKKKADKVAADKKLNDLLKQVPENDRPNFLKSHKKKAAEAAKKEKALLKEKEKRIEAQVESNVNATNALERSGVLIQELMVIEKASSSTKLGNETTRGRKRKG